MLACMTLYIMCCSYRSYMCCEYEDMLPASYSPCGRSGNSVSYMLHSLTSQCPILL